VENFTKAVEGLGLSLVEFFADLEESRAGAPSLITRVEAIETALALLQDDTAAAAALQRRLHDSPAANVLLVPGPGETFGTITLGPALDPSGLRDDIERRVVALIRATLDPLIDRLAAHVDPAVPSLRDVDPDPANTLQGRRGSLRQPGRPPRPPHVKEMLEEEIS
jgi:hypothetical protein